MAAWMTSCTEALAWADGEAPSSASSRSRLPLESILLNTALFSIASAYTPSCWVRPQLPQL